MDGYREIIVSALRSVFSTFSVQRETNLWKIILVTNVKRVTYWFAGHKVMTNSCAAVEIEIYLQY